MKHQQLGRWAVAGGILSVAFAAHATGFSTTESGYWALGTTGSVSTLVDSFSVSATNSPDSGLSFSSGLLDLTQTGGAAPLTGTLYLYGATSSDFLEFSLTGQFVTNNSAGAWVVAPGTLTASGGSFAGFSSGSGGLSANYLVISTGNGVTAGSSSSTFTGDVTPAPEPASFAALGIGLVGLRRLRRRK